MPSGSCLCGLCTIQITREPEFKALCHCLDCRKISGSTHSTNLFVGADACVVVSGAPREFGKATDKGNTITSYFCGDCGTTLWRESSGFKVCLFLCD
ncbi:MAG: hypothetical protein Q9207_004777 [Kuettlingeria erythrocarpa]